MEIFTMENVIDLKTAERFLSMVKGAILKKETIFKEEIEELNNLRIQLELKREIFKMEKFLKMEC